jgi:glycosyltransferase involved in cell wall biosynthesis
MKILIVSDDFYPVMGGRQRVIYEVSKRLVYKGYNIHVLTVQTDLSQAQYEEIEGIKIHRFPMVKGPNFTGIFRLIFKTKREFEKLAESENFDLVHLHNGATGFGVVLSRLSKKIKKIYTFHGPWHKEYRIQWDVILAKERSYVKRLVKRCLMQIYYFVTILIQKIVLRRCDKIVYLSNYSKEKLKELLGNIQEEKLVFIPGGVDTEVFFPVENKDIPRDILHLPKNKFIILTIRRLEYRMGIEDLLTAVSKIPQSIRGALIVLIGGKGPLEDRLKRLSSNLGLKEEIHFLGFIPDEQLPLYYQASDLFVLPSISLEGFGLATVEALACGLPVIGTESGATPELLEQVDKRLIFPTRNPDALAEKIIYFYENGFINLKLSHDDMVSMVRKKYSWDVVASAYHVLYSKLVGKGG